MPKKAKKEKKIFDRHCCCCDPKQFKDLIEKCCGDKVATKKGCC